MLGKFKSTDFRYTPKLALRRLDQQLVGCCVMQSVFASP